jgi:uncharacterized membrane protein YciS (DUF1049 family)
MQRAVVRWPRKASTSCRLGYEFGTLAQILWMVGFFISVGMSRIYYFQSSLSVISDFGGRMSNFGGVMFGLGPACTVVRCGVV